MLPNDLLEPALENLGHALDRLGEAVREPRDEHRFVIDSTIQRFEFTVELFWKALKKILRVEKIESTFPKDTLKKAFQNKLISDEQTWLKMLDDRNLSSHVYKEDQADAIYERVKQYYPVMRKTFESLKKQYG